VQYLHFRSNSSKYSFEDADPRLEALPGALRRELRVSLFLPVVKKLTMFGWTDPYGSSEADVRMLFDEIDADGDGGLDRDELKELVVGLGGHDNGEGGMSSKELDQLMEEMGIELDGEATFAQFYAWWKQKETKMGYNRMPKAPIIFMRNLSVLMKTSVAAPDDRIIESGDYGHHLYIVCAGTVEIAEAMTTDFNGEMRHIRYVQAEMRDPVFGSSAFLDNADHLMIHVKSSKRFAHWVAIGRSFCNLVWISRHDLREAVENFWPDGEKDLRYQALSNYVDRSSVDEAQEAAPEGSLKKRLLNEFGLRDKDEMSLREVTDKLSVNLLKVEGSMMTRCDKIEEQLAELVGKPVPKRARSNSGSLAATRTLKSADLLQAAYNNAGVDVQIAEENVDVLRTLFNDIDADRSGQLDRAEIAELSRQLGRPLDEAGLARAMAEMDADASGEVDFVEFQAWFQEWGSAGLETE
jgi:Ca2+-binding EF-hand superfamily protein